MRPDYDYFAFDLEAHTANVEKMKAMRARAQEPAGETKSQKGNAGV